MGSSSGFKKMDIDLSLDEIIEKEQKVRREQRQKDKHNKVFASNSRSNNQKPRRTVRDDLNTTPYQRNLSAGEMARAQGNAAARVYVHNLPYSFSWRDLKDHFAQAGEVIRADIMTSKQTQRSRGCGLVEFATVEEAQTAIETMNDSEIDGRKILVREDREKGDKPSAAPQNNNNQAAHVNKKQPDLTSHVGRQVFVNNLDKSITWQDLKDAFSPAGDVERADIIGDGRLSKGQGLILFKTHEAALKAIEEFHEGELKNKTISVKMDTKVGQYIRPTGVAGAVSTQKQTREPKEPRVAVPVSKRVYVHNLPYQVENEDLQAHFEAAEGAVVVASEVMRMPSGKSKGCGIVEFETVAMAANAIAPLNNSPLDGRNILVREDRESGNKETPAGQLE